MNNTLKFKKICVTKIDKNNIVIHSLYNDKVTLSNDDVETIYNYFGIAEEGATLKYNGIKVIYCGNLIAISRSEMGENIIITDKELQTIHDFI